MQNADFFFNAAAQTSEKAYSLETNLSEAIFRHFQYTTMKIAKHKMLAIF